MLHSITLYYIISYVSFNSCYMSIHCGKIPGHTWLETFWFVPLRFPMALSIESQILLQCNRISLSDQCDSISVTLYNYYPVEFLAQNYKTNRLLTCDKHEHYTHCNDSGFHILLCTSVRLADFIFFRPDSTMSVTFTRHRMKKEVKQCNKCIVI